MEDIIYINFDYPILSLITFLPIPIGNTTFQLILYLWERQNQPDTCPLPCWLLDRENSPWYPSVKLFRQSQFGQWADVIERVTSELENLPK